MESNLNQFPKPNKVPPEQEIQPNEAQVTLAESETSIPKEQPVEEQPKFPDLDELYKAEEIENPNQPIEYEAELAKLDENLSDLNTRVERLEAVLSKKKEDLERVRGELGMGPLDEKLPEEVELEALRNQQIELQEKKEEVEEVKELEGTLGELSKLPKEQLQIIILTGKMPNGEELKTPSGKPIKEDIAKSLAQAAEDGVTKITKAILKTILVIVKGILKGIFLAIKEVASK